LGKYSSAVRRLAQRQGNNWRSFNAAMRPCRFESRGKEGGDNKRKEQPVDGNTHYRRHESTTRASLGCAEQSDNAQHKAKADQAKRAGRRRSDNFSRNSLSIEH
jgi:hypothetical protein